MQIYASGGSSLIRLGSVDGGHLRGLMVLANYLHYYYCVGVRSLDMPLNLASDLMYPSNLRVSGSIASHHGSERDLQDIEKSTSRLVLLRCTHRMI